MNPDTDIIPAPADIHREAWLHDVAAALTEPFKRLGHPIPDKVRHAASPASAASQPKTNGAGNVGQTRVPAMITTKS